MTGPVADPAASRLPGALAWLGVALLVLCAMLGALLECFLVPLYAGRVIVPVAVPLAVAGNIVVPRLAHALVGRNAATAAPLLGWLLVVTVLGFVPRPEGDVVLPGAPASVEYVVYAMVLGGMLAGALTLIASSRAEAAAARTRPGKPR